MSANPEPTNDNGWNRMDWVLVGFNTAAILIMFLTFNHQLPPIVGSHFNIAGELDDSMPKWGFWLLNAGLSIGLPVVLKALRLADPRKANYAKFGGYFDLLRWALSLFLNGVFLMAIFKNLDYDFPMFNIVLGGFGVLWAVTGNRMGQVRSNFFIGFRTPWTLMDDRNWSMTHRLGARLWVAAGVVMFAASWFIGSNWVAAVLLTCTLASSIIPLVYSYLLFARQRKKT